MLQQAVAQSDVEGRGESVLRTRVDRHVPLVKLRSLPQLPQTFEDANHLSLADVNQVNGVWLVIHELDHKHEPRDALLCHALPVVELDLRRRDVAGRRLDLHLAGAFRRFVRPVGSRELKEVVPAELVGDGRDRGDDVLRGPRGYEALADDADAVVVDRRVVAASASHLSEMTHVGATAFLLKRASSTLHRSRSRPSSPGQ